MLQLRLVSDLHRRFGDKVSPGSHYGILRILPSLALNIRFFGEMDLRVNFLLIKVESLVYPGGTFPII